MKKNVLKQYARLIAQVGGNVSRGQEVVIHAGLDTPEFVELLVRECYRLGAERVTVDWDHQPLTRLAAKHQRSATLGQVLPYEEARWRYRADKLPVMLYLESSDPDGLSDVPQPKFAKALQKRMQVIKPIRDTMENRYQWCIAAVPGAAWARKMFPGLRTSQAVEKQWEAILSAARADGDDPAAAWKAHAEDLAARGRYLNGLGLRELRYRAGNGTDLRVGLIEGSRFAGGAEKTLDGRVFMPNIPTEEVFISPRAGDADGIVYSSRPLSYNGQLIDCFSVRFEAGRAVEVHAEQGEAVLREMIAMDDGAARLGECALVPADSPISRSGLTFYSTLFDENASCHLAFGRGFNECLEGFESLSAEEIHRAGINDSMIHVDFMIGTDDLSIDGRTADGRSVALFRNGKWAF